MGGGLPRSGWAADRKKVRVVGTALGELKADEGVQPDPVECDGKRVFDTGLSGGIQVRRVDICFLLINRILYFCEEMTPLTEPAVRYYRNGLFVTIPF